MLWHLCSLSLLLSPPKCITMCLPVNDKVMCCVLVAWIGDWDCCWNAIKSEQTQRHTTVFSARLMCIVHLWKRERAAENWACIAHLSSLCLLLYLSFPSALSWDHCAKREEMSEWKRLGSTPATFYFAVHTYIYDRHIIHGLIKAIALLQLAASIALP